MMRARPLWGRLSTFLDAFHSLSLSAYSPAGGDRSDLRFRQFDEKALPFISSKHITAASWWQSTKQQWKIIKLLIIKQVIDELVSLTF